MQVEVRADLTPLGGCNAARVEDGDLPTDSRQPGTPKCMRLEVTTLRHPDYQSNLRRRNLMD